MNTFGTTFQLIRINKNVSLRDVSEGIASKSFIAKFEKGTTNISFDKLMHLLERLNVTIEEFLFLDSHHDDTFSLLLDDIDKAYSLADIDWLTRLAEEQMRFFHDTKIVAFKCNSIMIRSLIADLEDCELDKELSDYIVDYLFGVIEWTLYELVLFANSAHRIGANTLTELTIELLNKTDIWSSLEKNKRILVGTLLNTARIFIEKGDQILAGEILTKVNRIPMSNIYYSSRTNLLFTQGLFDLKFGDLQKGIEKCNDALHIMEKLGDVQLAKLKKHYLDQFGQ